MNKARNMPGTLKKFIIDHKVEILLALFFVLTRMPGLGREIFNTDVWKWKARSYDFGEGVFTLNFEKTIQKYHPGVTLMWVGVAGIKAYNAYYRFVLGHPPVDDSVEMVFELHFVQKFFLVLVLAVVLGFSLHILRKHFGKKYAGIFGLLLILEPFYYALTRVFHLEGLMSTLMLASFVWFYDYLVEKRVSSIVVSALFGALAILTKTSALYMVPFIALISGLNLLFQWLEKRSSPEKEENKFLGFFIKHFIKPLLIWVGCLLAFVFLFWPALWTHAIQTVQILYRGISTIGMERGHDQIYFGDYTNDPGFLYYIVVLAFRSTPLLLIALLGGFLTIRHFNRKEKIFFLYAFLFSLFYLVQIALPSKKLDRYLLPSLVSLALLATFFVVWLVNKLGKSLGKLLVGLILITGILRLVNLQHDYFSYFSPLTGGLEMGIYVLEPKWIIGHHELVRHFEPLGAKVAAREDLFISFPEKYYTQIYPFIVELGGRPGISERRSDLSRSTYVVFPVWEDLSSQEMRVPLEYKESVYLRGVEVHRIYVPSVGVPVIAND